MFATSFSNPAFHLDKWTNSVLRLGRTGLASVKSMADNDLFDSQKKIQCATDREEIVKVPIESLANHAPRLARIARGRGVPPQDCEDVAQEAILDALRQLQKGNFRYESKLETWLVQILHGKIADYWRRKPPHGSLVSLTTDNPENLPGVPQEALLSPQADFEVVLDVRKALLKLPSRKRLILLLNASQGWTIEEIAKQMGWKPGTVGRQLMEAKREFCKAFAGKKPG